MLLIGDPDHVNCNGALLQIKICKVEDIDQETEIVMVNDARNASLCEAFLFLP